MARAEINLADCKVATVDLKDPRKVVKWIITRTEKRTGLKTQAAPAAIAERKANE